MQKFKKLFNEAINKGGQCSGKLEMKHSSEKDAKAFADCIFDMNQIPEFSKNFNFAKKQVNIGKLKRSEMPVITSRDVHEFKDTLQNGLMNSILDLPFNVGKVNIKMKKVKAKSLKPIQDQLYFDKSMTGIAKNGIGKTRSFLKNITYFITSSDSKIIDGHHRWLQSLIIDPEMQVQILEIDMPIDKLLPVARLFGDYVGNTRNK